MAENDFDKNQDNNGNQDSNNGSKGFYEEEFEKSPRERNQAGNEYYRGVNYSQYPYHQQSRPQKKAVTIIIAALVVVASLVLGYIVYPLANTQFDQASMYQTAMDILNANYLYEFDYDTVYSNMYKGNALGLDRYTRIFDPYEYYELIYSPDSDDAIYGISHYLATDEDGKALFWGILVMLDSAADLAGLMDGDEIYKINNTTITTQTTSSEISTLLSGTAGKPVTKVTMVVKREGKILDPVEIEKAKIKARYVEFFFTDAENYYTNFRYKDDDGKFTYDTDYTYSKSEKEPEDFHHYKNYSLESVVSESVGFIRLHEFTYTAAESNSNSTADFDLAMQNFKKAYNKNGKLVLDLRFNRGGFNAYCSSVSSYFIYNGTAGEELNLYNMKYKDGTIDSYTVKTKYADYFQTTDYKKDRNIVVLTNDWSASASELLTGAALAYETIIQVGTQTYGKGVSQTVIPILTARTIYNGEIVFSAYAIYFTFAFFYTPKVEGSQSIYSDYCNHNDMNGDSINDNPLKGYLPEDGNVLTITKEIMQRAKVLLKAA